MVGPEAASTPDRNATGRQWRDFCTRGKGSQQTLGTIADTASRFLALSFVWWCLETEQGRSESRWSPPVPRLCLSLSVL